MNRMNYRFRVKEWLSPFSARRKRLLIHKIVKACGQSRFTIQRIIYMKITDSGYVRFETKLHICEVLGKDLTEFEYEYKRRINP